MSDTKILSGEQVRNVFRMGSDISMVQVCDSHYAQAQRIAELIAKVNQERDWFSEAQKERDAALLRAEAAEDQVKALLEALPAERAEEMMRTLMKLENRGQNWSEEIIALRAYAAAAKPKER